MFFLMSYNSCIGSVILTDYWNLFNFYSNALSLLTDDHWIIVAFFSGKLQIIEICGIPSEGMNIL